MRVGVPRATLPCRAPAVDARAATGTAPGITAALGAALRIRCGVQKVRAIRVSAADTRCATPGPSAVAEAGAESAHPKARTAAVSQAVLDESLVEARLITSKTVLSIDRVSPSLKRR